MARMIVLVYMFAVVVIANSQKIRFKIYNQSIEMETSIPPPPLCEVKLSTQIPTLQTKVTLWRTSSSKPVGTGMLIRKVKISTICSTSFFGSHEKTITKRIAAKPTIAEALDQVYRDQLEDTWIDPTEEPAYVCRWLATENTVSTRIQSRVVDIYVAEGGNIIADGITWFHTNEPGLWYNGLEYIVTRVDLSQACPFVPFQTIEGISTLAEDGSIVFLGVKNHLRLVIDPFHRASQCASHNIYLYPTDVGIPVTYNITQKIIQNENKGMVSLENLALTRTESLFQSSVTFELQQLADKINDNFASLDAHLCKLRTQDWSKLVRSGSPDELAVYITGDIFARGRLSKGKLYVQVREPMIVEIELSSVEIAPDNYIMLTFDDRVIRVEPGSGIISPKGKRELLMPPILETESGLYYNLISKSVQKEGPPSWIHTQILLDNLNVSKIEGGLEGGRGLPELDETLQVEYISFLASWYRHYWVLIISCLGCIGLWMSLLILKKVSTRPRRRTEEIEIPALPPAHPQPRRGSYQRPHRQRSRSRSPEHQPGWQRRYF